MSNSIRKHKVPNEEFPRFVANLVGPFQIKTTAGLDCTPAGAKAQAILLLLLLSPDGKRSRSWIQAKLWSESPPTKGSNSLRRELSNIKQKLSEIDATLLSSQRGSVAIDVSRVELSTRRGSTLCEKSEIFEGLYTDSREFEDWLDAQRERIELEVTAATDQQVTFEPTSKAIGNETLPNNAIFPTVFVRRVSIRAASHSVEPAQMSVEEEILTGLATLAGRVRTVRKTQSERQDRLDYGVEVIVSQKPGDKFKVNSQIYFEETNELIASDRFEITGLIEAEERIARRVVETLLDALFGNDLTRLWTKLPVNQDAWDEFQRGRVCENRGTKPALAKARAHYERAIELDGAFYPAKISLGFTILDEIRLRYQYDLDLAKERVKELCLELDRCAADDPYATALRAFQKCIERQYLLACSLMEAAIERMPQSAELTGYAAAVFGYSGDHEREISYYSFATKLTRHPPVWVYTNMIFAMVVSRQGDVWELAKFIEKEDPSNTRLNLALLIHSLDSGDRSQTAYYAARVRKLDPGFSAKNWRSRLFCRDDRRYTDVILKLRNIGFD